MRNRIVAPLALLASLSLLTSCTAPQNSAPVTPAPTQTTPATETPVTSTTPVDSTVMVATGMNTATVSTGNTATVTPVAPALLTHTETVSYNSPAGKEEIEFSVSVKDGIVESATATPKATNDISKKLQTSFAANVSSKAVGMKAKDIKLDAVGGASLTTAAFETFVHSF